jgi:hypothetical protein
MASWKKVLVSGSSIEVNQISASGVPTVTGEQNLLAYTSDGGIKQIAQSDIAGTNPTFNLEAVSGSTTGTTNFTTTGSLIFSHSLDHGFGFTLTDNPTTSSIVLQTPQDLRTTASPTFDDVNVSDSIFHDGDTNTKIAFTSDTIKLHAGEGTYPKLTVNSSGIILNDSGQDYDFTVETGQTDPLFHIDAGRQRIFIGTGSSPSDSLLKVDGTILATGITASALPANTDSTVFVVSSGSTGEFETRDIQPIIDTTVGSATASFSASIVGTTNEVEVTAPSPGNIQIGLTDNIIVENIVVNSTASIGGGLSITGATTASGVISASGGITASSLRVDNDIALGGNIFSFSGFSFIEGVSANFSGSNVFGSGSTPAANDIAGGGIAHQFTGSVGITGSVLALDEADLTLDNGSITATNGSITLTNGAVTANNGTGSFGYLTAAEISSSGNLFAELPTDSSAIADGVVVYDTTTGQLLLTASSAVGTPQYPDLNEIPSGIISESILSAGASQGLYDLSANGVVVSNEISSGLTTGSSPTFINLTLTGSALITGSATIGGQISGSGALFASLSLDNSNFNTVMYDTTAGKFYYTGSYGNTNVNFDELGNIPDGIVSASAISSDSQGTVTQSINGVDTNIDLGLKTTSSPTFNNLTLTNDLTVGNDVTITGDLFVEGDTTSINTANLTVEDTFILLGSGSADGGSLNDGGIIVEQSTAGTGTALFWDTSAQTWAIEMDGANHLSTAGQQPEADVNVVTVHLSGSIGVPNQPFPIHTPLVGAGDGTDEGRKGQFFVDASDDHGLYVYM